MNVLIGLLAVFFGSLMTVACLMATYYWLPRSNLNHRTVRIALRTTRALREPSVFWKIIYYLAPVAVFLYSSAIGGLFLITAAICGVIFNRAWVAKQAAYSHIPHNQTFV